MPHESELNLNGACMLFRYQTLSSSRINSDYNGNAKINFVNANGMPMGLPIYYQSNDGYRNFDNNAFLQEPSRNFGKSNIIILQTKINVF